MKEFYITSYYSGEDGFGWMNLTTLDDEEIDKAIYDLRGYMEFWVCMHDTNEDSLAFCDWLKSMAKGRGLSLEDMAEQFREHLQAQGLDLIDRLQMVRSLSDFVDRESELDTYVMKLVKIRSVFAVNTVVPLPRRIGGSGTTPKP
jgi:hypothetical protein